jgi:hypothetical protein
MSTKLFLKQLKNIESIVKHKEEALEEEYFEKYHAIFDEAQRFLAKETILLYGGLAINELLPKKHQFYGDKELPDFDMFSTEGKSLATRAVHHFKKHGYPLASSTEALHENTYKVMVSGLPVLDITHVSKNMFEKLSIHKHKTKYGLYTVNPEYLRMTLHQLLSQPKDAHRWIKLFKRVVSFYEVFPPDIQSCKSLFEKPVSAISPEQNEVLLKTFEWIRENHYMVFSPDAWLSLLPKRNTVSKKIAQVVQSIHFPTEIIVNDSKDLDSIAKHWFQFIQSKTKESGLKITPSRLSFSKIIDNNFTPKHVYIYLDKKPIVGIYTINACVSYFESDDNETNKLHIASVQTILRMYMQMILSEESIVDINHVKCMVNLLTDLSVKSISRSKNEFLKSFILSCYGTQPGMATMKRERYERGK